MSDFGYKGSITGLESGINRIASDLRGEGFNVFVDVFKGQSSCPITGYASCVDIEILNRFGDVLACLNFECNGYGDKILTMRQIRTAIRKEIEENNFS